MDLASSIEILKNLGVMSSSIAQALDEAATKLPELTKGWFLSWFGDSPLDDLEEAIPALTKGFGTLARFMRSVVAVTHDVFSDVDQAKQDVELVKGIATAAAAVAEALTLAGGELVDLTEKKRLEELFWWRNKPSRRFRCGTRTIGCRL